MNEWQPIETAPKDGSVVVIKWWSPGSGLTHEMPAQWKNEFWPLAHRMEEGWWIVDGGLPLGNPTHWKSPAGTSQ